MNNKRETIIQKTLNLPELRKYFSNLPRYRGGGETYFYLLANTEVDTGLDLSIRKFRVGVMEKHILQENNIKNYLVIKSLDFSESEKKATITVYYKNPRLEYFEDKFLKFEARLDKTQNHWEAVDTDIEKIALKFF